LIPHIENDLIAHLKNAKKISIAVALLKDYGLNIIESNIPKNCIRRYLLGIHLPTPPDILRKLKQKQSDYPNLYHTKIYNSGENYHPKVYLIETIDERVVAIVGSANGTRGGFVGNIEMNIVIVHPQECNEIQKWFDTLFISANDYDYDFLELYEKVYKRNRILATTEKSNTSIVTNNSAIPSGKGLVVAKGQFFRQSDFDAFDRTNHFDTSPATVKLRAKVKERLIELGHRIKNRFIGYGILDLHLPYRRNLYTSQHFHSRGNVHIAKQAIWLNFGKGYSELNRYPKNYKNFVSHSRIQVILVNSIHEAFIGIWLYLAKPNWSYYDRKHLKDNLSNPNFAERLYEYTIALGGAYWIMLGDKELYISEIETAKQLIEFLLTDDYTPEFIIGRNYNPNDTDISDENIDETTLIEFSKLYKIYDLIRDKQ
jgi:HKD family nuclease